MVRNLTALYQEENRDIHAKLHISSHNTDRWAVKDSHLSSRDHSHESVSQEAYFEF